MSKQEEIQEFILPDKQFVMSATAQFLTEDYLGKVISERNKEWFMYRDHKNQCLTVRCKNKPRNLPVYGLSWRQI